MLVLFLSIPLLACILGGLFAMGVYIRKLRFGQFYQATRFEPDANGNYPKFYNPKTGDYYEPAPGNKPYPNPSQNILITNGQVQRIPRFEHERPVVHNYGGPKITVSGPRGAEQNLIAQMETPETLETGDFEATKQLETGVSFQSVSDFKALLTDAKRKGTPMREAIPDITGVKPGGSKAWQDWANIWKQL